METKLMFETLGTTGSLVVCASAVPQIMKTYRTKSSDDLSMLYLGILMFGMSLLQLYSLYVKDFVFIFGNTLSVSSTGILIILCFKYKNHNPERKLVNGAEGLVVHKTNEEVIR